jgi:hypothetical protein
MYGQYNLIFKSIDMKTMKMTILLAIVTLFLASGVVSAQGSKSYKNGSIWSVGLIKIKPGMKDDYLTGLKATWKAVNDEAIRQGLLVSYKILAGNSSSPEDWDLMLMQEYKDMATMEASQEKFEAISKKIVGGDEAMKTLMQNRVSMRDMYGNKLMRELNFN